MFAPDPLQLSGWYIFSGTLEDGSEVDPFFGDGKPLIFAKPNLVSATFPSQHWRKYFIFITKDGSEAQVYRNSFARYLCNKWNDNHNNKIFELKLFLFYQIVDASAKKGDVKQKILINQKS